MLPAVKFEEGELFIDENNAMGDWPLAEPTPEDLNDLAFEPANGRWENAVVGIDYAAGHSQQERRRALEGCWPAEERMVPSINVTFSMLTVPWKGEDIECAVTQSQDGNNYHMHITYPHGDEPKFCTNEEMHEFAHRAYARTLVAGMCTPNRNNVLTGV